MQCLIRFSLKAFCNNMKFEVRKIQENFCEEIQKLEETKPFHVHKWSNKTNDANGITKILEDGDVFDKVAVSTVVAHGILSKAMFLLLKGRKENGVHVMPEKPTYFTSGINGVAYPKNPHVPALHFTYRYFELKSDEENVWWFAGGTDLVPYILNREDCLHFHKVLKICCDKFDKNYYRDFKKACDEHFYLEHREERRGIGGIFFNELNSPDQDTCSQFVSACMKSIVPSYMPIVMKNKDKNYLNQDTEWKRLLRGRDVEFSFISDKATKLVLMTPGVNCENLLISLPPLAKWQYNYCPLNGSKEKELLNLLQNPVEWV